MPPPLFDELQIANALRNRAVPALEGLSGSVLEREFERRFGPDDPPPYQSSTDDDDDYYDVRPPANVPSVAIQRKLDEPLDDGQRQSVAQSAMKLYAPSYRYRKELELEVERIGTWVRRERNCGRITEEARAFLVQYGLVKEIRAGMERVNIIARRNIRLRWQKLGVWNSRWGIPDRRNNPQANDDPEHWKWSWQDKEAAIHETDVLSTLYQHPVTRAMHLRKGLRRSGHSPVIPRSHLSRDPSIAQAESFLTTRPWFLYEIHRLEEVERRMSIPAFTRTDGLRRIQQLWEDKEEWKAEWAQLVGWKWRHESPSPEPEDLSGLADIATFELSPSEADAFKAVPPPTPLVRPQWPVEDLAGDSAFACWLREAAATEDTTLPQLQRQRRARKPRGELPTRRSARIAAQAAEPRRSTRAAARQNAPQTQIQSRVRRRPKRRTLRPR